MGKRSHGGDAVASTDNSAIMRPLTTTFEGMALSSYTYRGVPAWIAQDVGRIVGYDEVGFRSSMREWDSEIKPGKDFEVLRGQELREFKELLDASARSALGRASSLKILRESGVYLICQKTHLPLGVKLRRHLADEVLPRLARGQAIVGQNSSGGISAEQLEAMLDRAAKAGAASALAEVAMADLPTVRPGDEHRLGRGIGKNAAELYVLEPLREVAHLKAKAICNDRDTSAFQSILKIADTELRRALGHSPLLKWEQLPIALLDEAANTLSRMRVDAENLARRSGFVRDAAGQWVRSQANAKQLELAVGASARRGRRRRRMFDDAVSRATDRIVFGADRDPAKEPN